MKNLFRKKPAAIKLIAVASIVSLGLIAQGSGYLDTAAWLKYAREYAGSWWFIPVMILLQVVAYTFALAGSYALWLVAPLFTPVTATLVLSTGGILGALSAYLFSKNLTETWIQRVENSRTYRVLSTNNDFLTSFSLRLMPGFPHGLINYSAGILKTRLRPFLMATTLGFLIKYFVYSSLVHSATMAVIKESSVSIADIWPLAAASLLLFLGIALKNRMYR